MSGKRMEGNEEQRRAAARRAQRESDAPSAQQSTTGGSKQRRHLPRTADHEAKQVSEHQGKQQWPTR